LEHNKGIVEVEDGTYRTSNPKVFAAGDIIFGGGKTDAMVVDAANHGRRAAHAIHQTLTDQKQPV
jgi:glutamate synthase (NADPH/NADH) small chain